MVLNGLIVHRSRVSVLAICRANPERGNRDRSLLPRNWHHEHYVRGRAVHFVELISHRASMPRIREIAIQTAIVLDSGFQWLRFSRATWRCAMRLTEPRPHFSAAQTDRLSR